MIHRFYIEIVIKTILREILKSAILLISYTNLKFFHNCFVKLSIIEKN